MELYLPQIFVIYYRISGTYTPTFIWVIFVTWSSARQLQDRSALILPFPCVWIPPYSIKSFAKRWACEGKARNSQSDYKRLWFSEKNDSIFAYHPLGFNIISLAFFQYVLLPASDCLEGNENICSKPLHFSFGCFLEIKFFWFGSGSEGAR